MKALRYTPSVPRYLLARALGKRFPKRLWPLALAELELAVPPGWQRLAVRLCGVCGSDLALLQGKSSLRLSPFFSFPAVLGHEILAECEGSRVAVNPLLSCRERGLPLCDNCQKGQPQRCLKIAEGGLAPGMLGFCRDLPGGFGEAIAAHPAQLYPVADGVPDARAVLAEPLAVALHGLKLAFGNPYRWPAALLVVGGGSIGLITVRLLRLAGFAGRLEVIARYRAQAEMARRLGADRVHPDAEAAALCAGAKSYPAPIGPPARRGGFAAVIDAAGSASSLSEASWLVAEGGTLLLLGAPGALAHDFAPYWFRELTLVGSYVYREAEFGEAVALLAEAAGLEQLVRCYPLAEYRQALAALTSRRALKVALAP